MALRDDPLLQYAVPGPRRPGLLVAAEWLNYFCVVGCLVYLGLGGLLLRMGLAARAGQGTMQVLGVMVGSSPDYVVTGLTIMGYAVGFGTAAVIAARMVRVGRRRRLSRGLALLTCLFFPVGTATGLFTFLVLGMPKVRLAFGDKEPA